MPVDVEKELIIVSVKATLEDYPQADPFVISVNLVPHLSCLGGPAPILALAVEEIAPAQGIYAADFF